VSKRRKSSGDGSDESKIYECKSPPCIHIVVDRRRKLFKVFVEDYDIIAPLPIDALEEACTMLETLEKLVKEGYREARGSEVDFLARKYLEAEPFEEDVVER